mgnify:CR=1 FL=1
MSKLCELKNWLMGFLKIKVDKSRKSSEEDPLRAMKGTFAVAVIETNLFLSWKGSRIKKACLKACSHVTRTGRRFHSDLAEQILVMIGKKLSLGVDLGSDAHDCLNQLLN